MKKLLFPIVVFLLCSAISFSQKNNIKWYSISEAEKLLKENPRPVFIDTYTDWCGWCKKLDQDTFSNPVITEILNTKFYPVKLNAEGSGSITFQGKTYINDGKSGKAHQLAVELLQGRLSYPTVVFLNEKGQMLTPVPGYRVAKDMEVLLSYFAGKEYEKESWEDYQKEFKGRIQ
jgi:thioredoxin-related protein